MSFLSYGSAKGLSVRHDFQQDIDRLYQREAYKRQVQAEREQKARYYAELMKEHDAESPWIRSQLEEKYKDLNNQIADFAIENPNFETDVNLMQKFLGMTDEYLNNDLVRMDMQSKQQYQKMIEAFNNGEILEEQWYEESEKYDTWLQQGTDAGPEFSNGYIYNGSKLPTYNEVLMEGNKALESVDTLEKQGNLYYVKSSTPEERISKRAIWDIQDPVKGKVIQKHYERVNEMFPGLYNSALDFHVKSLSAGEVEKMSHLAWDRSALANAADRRKAQENMMDQFPAYVRNIASNWQIGSTIAGHKGMDIFTPAGKNNGTWTLGPQDVAYVRDEKTGKFNEVQLSGTLVQTNVEELMVTPDGAYIQANFRTNVNEAEIARMERIAVTIDGVKQDMTQDEFTRYINSLEGLNSSEKTALQNLEGEEIRARDPEAKGRWNKISASSIDLRVTYGEQYKNAGFESSGVYTPGAINFMSGEKGNFPVYQGKLWVKADISQPNLAEYEKLHKGQAGYNKQIEGGELTRQGIIQRAFSEGNYQFALDYLNNSKGGGWRYDDENDGRFIKKQTTQHNGKTYNTVIYDPFTDEFKLTNR